MAVTQILFLYILLIVTFVRGDELRFLVLGDWGGMEWYPHTTGIETAVSKGMGKIAERLGTQFTIGLGKEWSLLQSNHITERWPHNWSAVLQCLSCFSGYTLRCDESHIYKYNIFCNLPACHGLSLFLPRALFAGRHKLEFN